MLEVITLILADYLIYGFSEIRIQYGVMVQQNENDDEQGIFIEHALGTKNRDHFQ